MLRIGLAIDGKRVASVCVNTNAYTYAEPTIGFEIQLTFYKQYFARKSHFTNKATYIPTMKSLASEVQLEIGLFNFLW